MLIYFFYCFQTEANIERTIEYVLNNSKKKEHWSYFSTLTDGLNKGHDKLFSYIIRMYLKSR